MNITEGETKYIELEITDATTEELVGGSATWGFGDVVKTGTLNGNVFTIKLEPSDTIGKASYYKYETKIIDAQSNVSYPRDLQGGITIKKSEIVAP